MLTKQAVKKQTKHEHLYKDLLKLIWLRIVFTV